MHRAEALSQDIPAIKFAVSRRMCCSTTSATASSRTMRNHQLVAVHAPTQTARVPWTAFIAAMRTGARRPLGQCGAEQRVRRIRIDFTDVVLLLRCVQGVVETGGPRECAGDTVRWRAAGCCTAMQRPLQ